MTVAPRLAYVCLQATREGQASHAHVHEIIHELQSRGWAVELFEPRYASAVARPSAATRAVEILRVQERLRRQIGEYDAVYVRDHPLALRAVSVARRAGLPIVLEVNGPYDELFISYPWTKFLGGVVRRGFLARANGSSGVIAVTELLARWLTTQGVEVPVTVIGNGANASRFVPLVHERTDVSRYALFFGALARWQGVPTLMAAVRESEWPQGVELLVAGEGAEGQTVKDTVDAGYPVRNLGAVPYRDMPALVAGAMACLIPKNTLGDREKTGLSPIKLYEAMACAVPVVVTDIPGQADEVRATRSGIVVPPDDPRALACAVRALAENPEEAAAMGLRGRQAVVERYSWTCRGADTDRFIRRFYSGVVESG